MNTNYLIKSSLERLKLKDLRLLGLKEIRLETQSLISILSLHYFEKNHLEMAQLFHRKRKNWGLKIRVKKD